MQVSSNVNINTCLPIDALWCKNKKNPCDENSHTWAPLSKLSKAQVAESSVSGTIGKLQ
jgi:hypothetical protein